MSVLSFTFILFLIVFDGWRNRKSGTPNAVPLTVARHFVAYLHTSEQNERKRRRKKDTPRRVYRFVRKTELTLARLIIFFCFYRFCGGGLNWSVILTNNVGRDANIVSAVKLAV